MTKLFGTKLNQLSEEDDWIIHCPGCNFKHRIPGGNRWAFNNNPDAPTFSPSIKHTMGPEGDPITGLQRPDEPDWRVGTYFITNGMIQFFADCWHHLSGQPVR